MIDITQSPITISLADHEGKMPVVCPRCEREWVAEGIDWIQGFARASDGRHWLWCAGCLSEWGRGTSGR